MPSVFLSYRRINDEHNHAVCELGVRLEAAGITVVLDQFAQDREFNGGGPDEGWPIWCEAQAADPGHKVLIMASTSWFKVYETKEVPGMGLGAATEAQVIRQLLYNNRGISRNIRIVGFANIDPQTIPLTLQRYDRFTDPDDFARLVRWVSAARPTTPTTINNWPGTAPPITWLMADHDKVREGFAQLMTEDAPFRYLPVQGPSESGKTRITKQLLGNALQCKGLACGRFDFKGTTDVESELHFFVLNLGLPVPPAGPSLIQRLGSVLEALTVRAQPALLIFDTFESAATLSQWVEDYVLVKLIHAKWLRVVVVGQKVPGKGGKAWDAIASPTLVLTSPTAEHWLSFGKSFKPDIDPEFVRSAYELTGGKPSLLSQMLGSSE